MPQLKKVPHTQGAKAEMVGETISGKPFKTIKENYLAALGLKPRNLITLHKEIERGFSSTVLRRIQHYYSFTFEELADALHVSPRTLERRKKEGRLDALESDRVLRFVRVYSKAVDLYEGNDEAALAWLKRKNRALGGVPPVDLIKTETGALQVEHLIGRLEYGVYS
jgi:putative toxin-antitoxin system antitoxin component (TIGR02293 family)